MKSRDLTTLSPDQLAGYRMALHDEQSYHHACYDDVMAVLDDAKFNTQMPLPLDSRQRLLSLSQWHNQAVNRLRNRAADVRAKEHSAVLVKAEYEAARQAEARQECLGEAQHSSPPQGVQAPLAC